MSGLLGGEVMAWVLAARERRLDAGERKDFACFAVTCTLGRVDAGSFRPDINAARTSVVSTDKKVFRVNGLLLFHELVLIPPTSPHLHKTSYCYVVNHRFRETCFSDRQCLRRSRRSVTPQSIIGQLGLMKRRCRGRPRSRHPSSEDRDLPCDGRTQ